MSLVTWNSHACMSCAAGAGWQQAQNGSTGRARVAPTASPQVPGGLAGARQTDGTKTAREALRFLFSPGEDGVQAAALLSEHPMWRRHARLACNCT